MSNNNGNNGYGYGYDCPNGYSSYGGCYSRWDSWGRWVVLALIIIGALVIFFLFSCLSARRRRRMGYAPYRGTGWAARPPPGHGPATYNQQPYYANNHPAQTENPPPAYGASQGYYGGRQNDVELQQPQQAYNSPYNHNENVYAAPQGPPPSKNDGIIR